MVINFNPKYIPGDIVYNHKKEIIRITSSYLKGTKLFYYRDGECGWIREDAIKPILITPEILEKNGWKKPDDFDSYWLNKIGLLQEGDTWHSALGSTKIAITLGNILYVHQLQHLLFGLGLNSEMEV